jgi:hypothetical protein
MQISTCIPVFASPTVDVLLEHIWLSPTDDANLPIIVVGEGALPPELRRPQDRRNAAGSTRHHHKSTRHRQHGEGARRQEEGRRGKLDPSASALGVTSAPGLLLPPPPGLLLPPRLPPAGVEARVIGLQAVQSMGAEEGASEGQRRMGEEEGGARRPHEAPRRSSTAARPRRRRSIRWRGSLNQQQRRLNRRRWPAAAHLLLLVLEICPRVNWI